MASSNIKLFDENKGNMLSDTEFNISNQRLNGLQTGVASSQLQNKAMYQASLMAYAIAQLMLANGKNANDTDAVSTFVNNLSASIVQKKLDKATKQDVTDGIVGKWISSELLKSNNEDLASIYLKLAGGTMSGDLFLNADPTSALQAVTKRYVDSNLVKLQTGSYVGTGTYGRSNPCSLTFNFVPVFVSIYAKTGNLGFNYTIVDSGIFTSLLSTSYQQYRGFFDSETAGPTIGCNPNAYGKKSSDGRTISWYCDQNDSKFQLNSSGIAYHWIAFG